MDRYTNRGQLNNLCMYKRGRSRHEPFQHNVWAVQNIGKHYYIFQFYQQHELSGSLGGVFTTFPLRLGSFTPCSLSFEEKLFICFILFIAFSSGINYPQHPYCLMCLYLQQTDAVCKRSYMLESIKNQCIGRRGG